MAKTRKQKRIKEQTQRVAKSPEDRSRAEGLGTCSATVSPQKTIVHSLKCEHHCFYSHREPFGPLRLGGKAGFVETPKNQTYEMRISAHSEVACLKVYLAARPSGTLLDMAAAARKSGVPRGWGSQEPSALCRAADTDKGCNHVNRVLSSVL